MQTRMRNKQIRHISFGVIATFALVLLLALTACSSGGDGNGNGADGDEATANDSQDIQAGGNLVIPTGEISETATFYPLTVDGTRMEVVAVKAPDETIRTAFNTCQVCNGSPKAYFEQNGNTLQCQNCGNKFPMDRVEVEAGGCNPVPIFDEDKTRTDESITIPYDTLQANAYRFSPDWKQ